MPESFTPAQLLNQQKEQLQQLETLLVSEREVLKQQKPALLTELTSEKNDLLLSIQSLDKDLGKNFEFLKEKSEGLHQTTLDQIKTLLLHCKEMNLVNGNVIQQSQLVVERLKTSLLDNQSKSSMTYDSKGKKSGGLSSLGIKA
jgi:flagella synthesis protein FlgN